MIAETIEVSKIKAKMEDGMLTVTLPKYERVKPRDIPIEVG
jgi:HSP20 family molecular chaperone IbpA